MMTKSGAYVGTSQNIFALLHHLHFKQYLLSCK